MDTTTAPETPTEDATPATDTSGETTGDAATAPPQAADANTTAETVATEPEDTDPFTPPQTQDELDALIKARLARAEAKVEERIRAEYADYVPKAQVEEATTKLAELTQAQQKAVRENAALRAGLDVGMAARLQGETAEELLADAQGLAELFKRANPSGAPREKRGVGAGDVDASAALSPEELAAQITRT